MTFKKKSYKHVRKQDKNSFLYGPEIKKNPEKQKAIEIRLEIETKLNSVRKRLPKKVGVTS